MQIDWTDIVDKQKIGGARELCRVTLRVRFAVSVLSHDTAVQSWEALGSLPCFANCHSMRSAAIPVCDLRSVCVTELEAYIGSSTCNMRNSVAARWPFQIFLF